jgi:hypothetical protein
MTCLRECSEMSLERGLGLLTDVGLKVQRTHRVGRDHETLAG